MVKGPSTDEQILANRAELVQWDAYNKQLYSVLFLCTKGVANSFLVRFAGRPGSRQQPDGQAAWRAMGENIHQLFDAAAAYSDAQAERHDHDAKSRP